MNGERLARIAGRRSWSTLFLAGATMIGVATAEVASAYWTGGGGGAGAATTGATESVILTPGAPGAELHPGGQSDVVLTVTNPNAAALHIGSLTLDRSRGSDGFAVDSAHPGCAASALAFTAQTNAGAGWTVPGRAGVSSDAMPVTLTDSLSMDLGAADACQGGTFTVYLAAGS